MDATAGAATASCHRSARRRVQTAAPGRSPARTRDLQSREPPCPHPRDQRRVGVAAVSPKSTLALWNQARFGRGNGRVRQIGIVALARKLLIALWWYLETGIFPEGAVLRA
jgi:hypothetical protein